ncbi:MAG TPA: ribbon-helix-helix protein, CopG family [Oscillatoriaceae cyanobacterium M33_DOE_052]|uniref:Ribbon-helix-helix protein, CopG family n=1 Tax=Planktothricoides sp. SpSt-374 TaxID=2282167 RepID=A0A7C3VKS1_9CYAN|nr:ribbon-helix-helix protein, CopG family [Oscillatoriaceae cyanobacterium M33_DOE_052]
MAREELLQIRLTKKEKDRLQAEAESRGVSMSEVIRDYIKRLPAPKKVSGGE